jgi:hypothetical protein
MDTTEQKEINTFLEKSINYLKTRGFEDIKTSLSGYESPKSFVLQNDGLTLSADITANKNGQKFLFDTGLKSKEIKLLKSKWLLLDTIARRKSYHFKIITTRGHFKFTDNMLNEINLTNKKAVRI